MFSWGSKPKAEKRTRAVQEMVARFPHMTKPRGDDSTLEIAFSVNCIRLNLRIYIDGDTFPSSRPSKYFIYNQILFY